MTPAELQADLDVARNLARAGVPVFVAPPAYNPDGSWDSYGGTGGYKLPTGWQKTVADPTAVDTWQPGMALAAVCGRGVDVIDVDPRNGGNLAALDGSLPTIYGEVSTPSGGTHHYIASLGIGKGQAAVGIDLQAGDPNGDGRGFVFLPPTLKRSKVDGREIHPYRWTSPLTSVPTGPDPAGAALAALVTSPVGEAPTPEGFMTPGPWAMDLDELVKREDGRNNAALKLAASLRAQGMTSEAGILAVMRQVVTQFPEGTHDFPDTELQTIVRSVMRYPAGSSAEGTASTLILTRSGLDNLPKVESLVEGVLSRPAAAVLVGAYGLGKSILAHALACSVATGRPWLGHKAAQHRVLFVIGEGAYGLPDRIAAWEADQYGGQRVPDDALAFVVKPSSLKLPTTWAWLTEMAVTGGCGLVVLDTFSSLAPDADEVKDAAQIMRQLSDLATAINGTALLVHHPGWSDAGRTRGGYQFEANADEVLVMASVAEDSPLVTVTRKKVKDGRDGEVLWLQRSARHGSVVIDSASPEDAAVPMKTRILVSLQMVGEHGSTGPQMLAEMRVGAEHRSTFYKALSKMQADGEVFVKGKGNGRRYYWHGVRDALEREAD